MQKSFRIGYIHSYSLCWTYFHYQLLLQSKHSGIELLDRPISSLVEQISQIDALLSEGINVLVTKPVSSENAELVKAFERARARGVHLISLDGSPGQDVDCYVISADNFGGQASMTQHVCQLLGGKGKIAHIQGDQRMQAGRVREQGLLSALQEFPSIKLVFERALNWASPASLRSQGADIARMALTAFPDLDAILTSSDECAFGAFDTLDELGLKDKVLLTGFDALPEGVIAIDEGKINASVYQPLDLMAQHTLTIAKSLMAGERPTSKQFILPTEIYTKATIGTAALNAVRIFPAVTLDLIERSHAQKATNAFLEALVDNMPTMLDVKDAKDLRYLRVNKAREAWLNMPLKEQVGKTAFDIYREDDAKRYQDLERAVLASGQMLEISVDKVHVTGFTTRYLHTRKIPIYDGNQMPICLLTISDDISDRIRAEEVLAQRATELELANAALRDQQEKLVAAEKMAALGSLVAGIAHELNTPIGNALLAASSLTDYSKIFSDQYAKGLSRSTLEKFLNEIVFASDILQRNLSRAADLITSFKQIAIDQTSAKPRHFELATLVAETLMILSPTFKKTPFVLQSNIEPGIWMDSPPGQLEQVLMNLLNNALLHGFSGRAYGSISVSARSITAERICIEVRDDGVGIASENIKRIFEPFFSTRFGQGGSGLGLSITHNIVTKLLGGEIEVHSTLNAGTRFVMELPIKSPSADIP